MTASYRFALVRPPAATFAAGITAAGLGPPDLARARQQHDAYCRTLERLGLTLVRLPPDPDYPDSTFVEDTAIIAGGHAILTRPGAPSRAGEVRAVGEALAPWFPEPARIEAPGTVDGGDVCEAGGHCFIGLSHRTNAAGAAQLAGWLAGLGIDSSVIDIRSRPALLHLKTGLSWLGARRLIAAAELVNHEALAGWDVLQVPPGEEYAANCVRVHDTLLVPQGHPATAGLLGASGCDVVALDMSEFRKLDGGLSCLSVRW